MNTKRILAALGCVIMIVSSIFSTGCGNKTDNHENTEANINTTRSTLTLNMYILTEDETDPDEARAVQMEINEITLPKYKTILKINHLKQDEYWEAIEDMELQITQEAERKEAEALAKKEAQKNGDAAKREKKKKPAKGMMIDPETGEEITKEEYDERFTRKIDEIFEAEDIELEEPQLDIFLVNSAEKFHSLIDEEKIIPIDTYLNFESKVLKSYLYPTFFAAANVGKKTYGVPVNKELGGDYEYFVFNKQLLDKYGVKVSDLTEIRTFGDYLEKIKQGEPGVVPLTRATTLSGFDFFGGIPGNALGVYKADNAPAWSTEIYPIFLDRKYFYRHFLALEDFRNQGFIPDGYEPGTPFAIDIRTSDTRPEKEWTQDGVEYVSYIYKLPRAAEETALSSVFVISSLSAFPERAMEMITLFNTNETLANLLQYGIKGRNYIFDEQTKSVEMLHSLYSMNPDYTGNRYIKYPLAGDEDYMEKSKAKNLDTVAGAFLGFRPALDEQELALLEQANEISRRYYDRLLNGEDSVADIFAAAGAELLEIGFDELVSGKIAGLYAAFVSSASPMHAAPPIVAERNAAASEASSEPEPAAEGA